MTIEVWAPRAERVRLRRPGHDDIDLTAGDAGWWAADVALAAGDEYGFVLSDGDGDGDGDAASDAVRPDPRSRRQPRGSGPSAQRAAGRDSALTRKAYSDCAGATKLTATAISVQSMA